jgi:hypothetical protein
MFIHVKFAENVSCRLERAIGYRNGRNKRQTTDKD